MKKKSGENLLEVFGGWLPRLGCGQKLGSIFTHRKDEPPADFDISLWPWAHILWRFEFLTLVLFSLLFISI